MNNAKKEQFKERASSYSTHGSRRGINMLGWEESESELTLAQKHDAICGAIDALREKKAALMAVPNSKEEKKRMGLQISKLLSEKGKINHLIKQLGRNLNRDFQGFLLSYIRESLGDEDFAILSREAQKKWFALEDERKQIGKPY